MVIQFFFGWAASNMNSLSMEPLGNVAGTAASVFGFTQTVGGALIGTFIGQHYDGTLVPNAMGYASMGALVLICVLIAEKAGSSALARNTPARPPDTDRAGR